ncbi:hypothetical protein DL96DRAFT_1739657 [Flagelloscypha sp. PMI_526]|nr:hypothetical protein DL96DRAFT_1739657 [Flagelloscypha sp. PMI_526]
MAAIPEQIKGKFWLLATMVAKAGFKDKVQEALTLIAQSAQSNAEPGTLQGVSEKSSQFIIMEKYASPEAFEAHNLKAAEHFKTLMVEGIESISLEFNEEF